MKRHSDDGDVGVEQEDRDPGSRVSRDQDTAELREGDLTWETTNIAASLGSRYLL
jgi:hypothetical protein